MSPSDKLWLVSILVQDKWCSRTRFLLKRAEISLKFTNWTLFSNHFKSWLLSGVITKTDEVDASHRAQTWQNKCIALLHLLHFSGNYNQLLKDQSSAYQTFRCVQVLFSMTEFVFQFPSTGFPNTWIHLPMLVISMGGKKYSEFAAT